MSLRCAKQVHAKQLPRKHTDNLNNRLWNWPTAYLLTYLFIPSANPSFSFFPPNLFDSYLFTPLPTNNGPDNYESYRQILSAVMPVKSRVISFFVYNTYKQTTC